MKIKISLINRLFNIYKYIFKLQIAIKYTLLYYSWYVTFVINFMFLGI